MLSRYLSALGIALGLAFLTSPASATDLVKDGKALAVIVCDAKPAPAVKGKKKEAVGSAEEAQAATLLAAWLKKITDAELPIVAKSSEGVVPIYVGKAAVREGLKLDDIDSPSREGIRIVVEPNRILIAGQTDAATVKAVARFLEELGCRYFMDGPLGEVYPRSANLSIQPQTITEKPGLHYRNPKGPTWQAATWKAWNGAGGESFGHSHSWGRYIPKGLYAKHPEYFAMGADGNRKDGDWLCTSNAEVRQVFADGVMDSIKKGTKHPSISPPDGRGYCQCEKCKAQDDPKSIEPSSGTIAVTNRYVDFYDEVARKIGKVYPDSVLSFYVYADYTQPPTVERKLPANLCAMIAPIRYCRLHGIGDEHCPSRKQQLEMTEGWSKVAPKLGYYNYMYNLADATLPMFKFTPCQAEFPYLADKGLTYMTIEVLSNWYIYGPQIYLSLRMAYNPRLDPAAVMNDYYEKFYGPAAPFMKQYWQGIDAATLKMDCHSGGFYGLSAVYTPEFIRNCQMSLDQAANAAKTNPVYAERVAMHAAGFQNLLDYRSIEAAMAKGDFRRAKDVYDAMTERIRGLEAKGYANREYGTSYLRRFLSKSIDGGLAATASPNKVLAVLPDRWKFHDDVSDDGEAKGFASATFEDAKWKDVATFSATLSRQGLEENAVLWYRSTFRVGEKPGKLVLLFTEVDGVSVTVFINGKAVEPTALIPGKVPGVPRRTPFEVDLTGVVKPGENVVAVRVDNRKISELFLGGILRPVLLVEKGQP